MSIETASGPPFGDMVRQMNKMMETLQKGFFSFSPSETWTPNVNLYETHNAYIVCVDLAGVSKEEIEIGLVENQLRIKGTRQVPRRLEGQNPGRFRVHLMEIDHGAFCRTVDLPPDAMNDQINARYDNGLLWVEIPKAPA